jgi:hypothetical protein
MAIWRELWRINRAHLRPGDNRVTLEKITWRAYGDAVQLLALHHWPARFAVKGVDTGK